MPKKCTCRCRIKKIFSQAFLKSCLDSISKRNECTFSGGRGGAYKMSLLGNYRTYLSHFAPFFLVFAHSFFTFRLFFHISPLFIGSFFFTIPHFYFVTFLTQFALFFHILPLSFTLHPFLYDNFFTIPKLIFWTFSTFRPFFHISPLFLIFRPFLHISPSFLSHFALSNNLKMRKNVTKVLNFEGKGRTVKKCGEM